MLLASLYGAAGGGLFAWFSLPLAWMLGAMVANTAASMAGFRVSIPGKARALMVAILGVMLGSAFRPDILDRVGGWWITLAGMLVYLVLAATGAYWYGRRLGRMDKPTAWFSGMPGGLSEMVIVGARCGGDERRIALMHGARVLMVVMTIPLILQGITSLFFPEQAEALAKGAGMPRSAAHSLSLQDILLLATCLLGWPLARWMRIPAAMLIGPMALSAAMHLMGLTDGRPPAWLIICAQLVVGSAIGCRFSGTGLREILHTLRLATGLTIFLLALTSLLAWPLGEISGYGWTACMLALAPGGLAEMSLIALSLNIDPAFVSWHHMVRIFLVVTLVPALYHFWSRKS